jgi:hypothetical protein
MNIKCINYVEQKQLCYEFENFFFATHDGLILILYLICDTRIFPTIFLRAFSKNLLDEIDGSVIQSRFKRKKKNFL